MMRGPAAPQTVPPGRRLMPTTAPDICRPSCCARPHQGLSARRDIRLPRKPRLGSIEDFAGAPARALCCADGYPRGVRLIIADMPRQGAFMDLALFFPLSGRGIAATFEHRARVKISTCFGRRCRIAVARRVALNDQQAPRLERFAFRPIFSARSAGVLNLVEPTTALNAATGESQV